MSNKCPKCERNLTYVNVDGVTAKHSRRSFESAVYTCPICNTILGVGADPIAFRDAIEGLIKKHK